MRNPFVAPTLPVYSSSSAVAYCPQVQNQAVRPSVVTPRNAAAAMRAPAPTTILLLSNPCGGGGGVGRIAASGVQTV